MGAPNAVHFSRIALAKIFLSPWLKPSPAPAVQGSEYTIYTNWRFAPHIFLKDSISFFFFFFHNSSHKRHMLEPRSHYCEQGNVCHVINSFVGNNPGD